MRSIGLSAFAAAVFVIGCNNVTSGAPSQAGQQIEIASELPLDGPLAIRDVDRIINVAFAQHPTVEGYRLVHVTLNDSLGGFLNSDRALQNMRRAVRDPAILGVIGPQVSAQAQVLIPMASAVNLTVLSPSNTLDCLTRVSAPCLASPRAQDAPTNYFRLASRDTLAARAAADLASHKLGITQFAVLTSPSDGPFAQPMAAAFSDEVAKMGGKVVYHQDLFPLLASFAPMLRDARAAGAQALYMSTGVDSACALRRDMIGIFPPDSYLIVGDRVADVGCLEDASLEGKTDDHFVLTIATAEPHTIPSALKVLDRGHGFDSYSPAAYDCASILIDAVGRAIRANGGKVPTREQVREAVAETSNFKGITGTYSFDANGDVVNPGFSFYTVQQGNWAFWRSP